MSTTTVIKIGINGKATSYEHGHYCRYLSEKIKRELEVWCTCVGNELIMGIEDRELIDDYLSVNQIDHGK